MLRVVTSQQELAKSKSKSYIDGGIKAVKASGIEDRKISLRGGLVILLIWYSSCYIASPAPMTTNCSTLSFDLSMSLSK